VNGLTDFRAMSAVKMTEIGYIHLDKTATNSPVKLDLWRDCGSISRRNLSFSEIRKK